jgi:hypothetical protein
MHPTRAAKLMMICAVLLATVSPRVAAQASPRKSIGAWVKCGGSEDQWDGVARAFQAARHSAFTLVVDCPLRVHIGTDIARTIFIDDGTSVEFSGDGKFIVDNVFHPAFVIANSSNIVLMDWDLEYDAGLPVDMKTGGYENAGKSVPSGSNAPPAGAFSSIRLTEWLTANRNVRFDKSQGPVDSIWTGPTNTSAVFFVTGDSGNIRVSGMRLHAPADAGGDRFVPMAFSLSANYKSNQRVTATTPRNPDYIAIPHDLVFSGIDLDGYYMGWQGNAQNVTLEKIRAHRYGDLQDAAGGNVGGVGKWFAPPHLFYFNYLLTGDSRLFNRNIRIHDVADTGPRVGVARDKGGSDPGSGFDMSLKIGGINCSVDEYTSSRPDGFVDVLSSDGLTISNVNASYDSSFLNDLYSGWRFPQAPYKRVVFKNILFKDVAAVSVQQPITPANQASNEGIVFTNVRVEINRWAGKGPLLPVIVGTGNSIDLEYFVAGDAARLRWQGPRPVVD